MSWSWPPAVSQACWQCRKRPSAVPCAWLPCRGLADRVVALYRDTCQQPSSLMVTIHPSILRYKPPQPTAASVTIQILYLDIAFRSQLPLLSQYTNVYCDTLFSPALASSANLPLCHNTISVLRHTYSLAKQTLPTCNTPHISIQNPANLHSQSHYVTIQCLYCDTVPMLKWAVAHSVPAPLFFFFVFHYIFFSHTNFQLLENTKNIYLYIYIYNFFSFLIFQSTQINL